MSHAVSTKLFALSVLSEKTAAVLLVAGLGLTAVWWFGKNGIENNSPAHSPAVVLMPEASLTRPQKDDVLASLPKELTRDREPAVGLRAAAVPDPTIVRKKRQAGRQPLASKDYVAPTRYDSCLPACESRDPLVPSNRAQLLETASFAGNYDDGAMIVERVGVGAKIIDRGSRLVLDAAYASRRALDVGKSVAATIVDVVR